MAEANQKMGIQNSAEELGRFARSVTKEARKSPMPVFIAAIAAFLALVSMANGAADKAAMQAHIESANQFAYFQAKNIRKTSSQIAADTFAAMGKDALAAKWQSKADRYSAEKKDILTNARAQQAKQLLSSKKAEYFGLAISTLQIAIVLASAALLLGGGFTLWMSVMLTILAAGLTANGYTLYLDIPTQPMALWHYLIEATGITITF